MSMTIFLFGPSCSGKSTLGLSLQNKLGCEWTYIDRDELIEQNVCTDATANILLKEKIKAIKNKIIIDAQIPWREKRQGEFYFIVLPSLEVLLKRDDERTVKLQRSQKQAYVAREYVIETYNSLSQINKKNFNHYFDSSRESINDEISTIQSIIKYLPK